MQTKGLFYLVVLIGLALLSQWFLFKVESSLRENTTQDSAAPSLYIDDFQATRMNIHGIREYTLTAPHLVQLSGQQGTQVQAPRIEIFQNGEISNWLISARNGWLSADTDLARLENDVVIIHPAASGREPLVITTQYVVIHIPENTAETAAPVRAETPGGVVTAVGLKAHFNEKKLDLLSDVRGQYASPPP